MIPHFPFCKDDAVRFQDESDRLWTVISQPSPPAVGEGLQKKTGTNQLLEHSRLRCSLTVANEQP